MKSKLFVLALISLFLTTCKKDKKTVEEEEAYTPHGNLLKNKRHYYPANTSGQYLLIVNFYMAYNNSNQLISITKIDSSFYNNTWNTNTNSIETFTYTTFNKILKANKDGATTDYIYDTSEKLQYKVKWVAGIPDTTGYSYSGSLATSKRKSDPYWGYTIIDFYSQNLDSTVTYDSLNIFYSKNVYYYNSKIDLATASVNQGYPLPDHKNELIKLMQYYSAEGYGKTDYTRTYDQQGYPVRETTPGVGGGPVHVYFSYY